MIREPAVAGTFYPSDPKTLERDVRSYLKKADRQIEAKAVVSPHAGYMYSGAVAGAVYGAVQARGRYIILGPNHTGRGVPMALHPAGQWRTPLGLARIDAERNARLLEECDLLREDHTAHQREHSLEVQVPFLQVLAGDLQLAAICVGTVDLAGLEELGHALARVIQSSKEPVLVVASSDMNHFESAEVNKRKDDMAIQHVVAVDPEGLHRVVCEEDISMCGFAPAVAALVCCRDMGATKGQLVRYSHSGDVTGDCDEVVSYAGMLIS
jgi:AmmeMemoRadiSam system protein B